MYKNLICCLTIFFTLTADAQTFYQRGFRSVTYIDPSRPGRAITTDLYYPANTAGTNVAIASGSSLFPVVVFGHGFVLPTSAYTKLADTLTRYGYIVAFPSTESGFSPSHDNFGKDLSYLCSAIIQSGNDVASFLYRRVGPKAAVGGHSMGGGCSFLAAASANPDIYALFNMAAAETNPSATTAAGTVSVPALLFSGSNDCIVPPSTQQSMYNNLKASCKSQVNITGATHCQIADNNFTCAFGQSSSGCNSSPINVTTVYTKTTELLIPFLDYTINTNCIVGVDYVKKLGEITGATVVSNCPSPSCSSLPLQIRSFKAKKINNTVSLQIETENASGMPYRLFVEKSKNGLDFSEWKMLLTTTGSAIFRKNITDSFPFQPESFYRIRMEGAGIKRYSDIVAVKAASEMDISLISGNVVQNVISLQTASDNKGPLLIRIIGMNGNKVFQNKYNGISAGQVISINLASVAHGAYTIEITNTANYYTKRIRFMKTD